MTAYYVSCYDAGRVVLLSGPYAEHQDALDRVRAVAELAGQLDPWAHFYAFGTCSVDCAPAMQLPFGKLDPYVRPEPL